jgi:UDP-N-acetylglucosamine 2-epimerase (non-hydrolysing)
MRPYALLTLHRPSNVDARERFLNILEGLKPLVRRYPVIFPVHPRSKKRVRDFGLGQFFEGDKAKREPRNVHRAKGFGGIRMIEPLGYLDFLCLMQNATLVVTDSGGIQEETTCLGVPCVTVRENTERPVTVEVGTNILAGVSQRGIRKAVMRQLASRISGQHSGKVGRQECESDF